MNSDLPMPNLWPSFYSSKWINLPLYKVERSRFGVGREHLCNEGEEMHRPPSLTFLFL